ncbi:uncharacterized protein LOC119982962 isoform X1 [Tripterygium wilfordii]|uniref:uncharacterized protein LOC119982962 isoform X1 n=1 Tax=Tripterygium wilfordii TaxID=458696 RepID=UPI0018F81947|nr:uncharacterized protein LOC119982962 isoform X1 [Tripterygium wilfordii]XP_038682507.1 uncharacterized protein LOC119982962 isoform X1 [Tripterygium wilfordii]XP_038682509.1 uncharacterized protein LOC119982962 isoform X1 [Tripterygium wilfordii]XP_038682510.1 uncharacterized protein LOC119982962 isoform X1 [Tripterygium wilfordii]
MKFLKIDFQSEAKVAKVAASLANFANFQTFVHNKFAKLPALIDSQIDSKLDSWRKSAQHNSSAISIAHKEFEELHQPVVLPGSGDFCPFEHDTMIPSKPTCLIEMTGSDPIVLPRTWHRLKIEESLSSNSETKGSRFSEHPSNIREIQGYKSEEKSNQNHALGDARNGFEEISQLGMELCATDIIDSVKQDVERGFFQFTFDPGGCKSVPLIMGQYNCKQNLCVLPLDGCGIVLRIQWLTTVSPVVWDCQPLQIEFLVED